MKVIVQTAKEILALVGSALSIISGLLLAWMAFCLAVAIQHRLSLLMPYLLVAALVPLLLSFLDLFTACDTIFPKSDAFYGDFND